MEYGPIVDTIVEAEERFAVDNWTIEGMHIWPVIRIRMYGLIAARSAAADAPGDAPPDSTKTTKKRQFTVRALSAVRRIAVSPSRWLGFRGIQSRLKKQNDALFYSLSHMRANVDGVWYDRHCDPVIDMLQEERGSKTLLLESAYEVPHRRPPAHAESTLEMDTWVAWLRLALPFAFGGGSAQLEGYEEFLDWVGTRLGPADRTQLTVSRITRSARDLRKMRAAFASALASSNPRACFVACYYHAPAMALAWASRLAGIPCVDLQHGMQANPAYSRWTKIPRGGYELVPEVFWNWTESESEGIREWADGTEGAHRSVVGGFPWLERFVSDGQSPLHSTNTSPADPGIRILFSMPTFRYELPDWIVETIRRSPDNWTWSFRLHPRQQDARERLRKVLKDCIPEARWELDRATDLPLPTVLMNVDVHVTHSSSVTIEAEYFGIRTVAIQNDAARSFRHQAASAVLVVATNPDDLLTRIRAQAAAKSSRKSMESGRMRTLGVLDSIMRNQPMPAIQS